MGVSGPESDPLEVAGLVSTVITSYNKGPYLAEAVDSALAQDYPHQEVILVDDGSTDNTRQVAESYGDRIRFIRQENRGQSAAKNRGVREARGEFIAFLDGDDLWRPGKLSKQVEVFRRNPGLALVYTDREVVKDGKLDSPSAQTKGSFYRGKVLDRLLVKRMITFSSAVVRRSCLVEVGMLDESLEVAPDFDLWLRLTRLHEIDFVDEVLTVYRLTAGSISNIHKIKINFDLKIMENFLAKYYGGSYPNPEVIVEALAERYTMLGDGHLKGRRYLLAFSAYRKALSYDPSSPRRMARVARSLIPNDIAALAKALLRRGRKDKGWTRAPGTR